jgi:integrase
MGVSDLDPDAHGRRPWNSGNMVGAKRPLKPRDVWAIRIFLDEHRRLRDRALFDLAIDSKLRGCDIVKMNIGDIVAGGALRTRATVIQQKTGRPVQFELMTEARNTLHIWLTRRGGALDDFIFPSRMNYMGHLSTRQYARLVDEWSRSHTTPCFTDNATASRTCSESSRTGAASTPAMTDAHTPSCPQYASQQPSSSGSVNES